MVSEYIKQTLTDRQKEAIHFNHEITQGMLRALDRALINNDNGIGLPHWAKKNPLIVKDVTFALDKLNIARTRVSRKFARLEINTELINGPEFQEWRIQSKLKSSLMRFDDSIQNPNLVKVNGKYMETGLKRHGFAKVAKNPFKLDTVALEKYREGIYENLVKSIQKGIDAGKIKDKFFADKANYQVIVNKVLDYYIANPDKPYNLEMNISDQRGRSIFKALKRIGNPISSKDFRALLIVPREYAVTLSEHSGDDIYDVYYFIAELAGMEATTEREKHIAGYRAYRQRILPTLDMTTDEGRKDLHEYIWLTRVYDKLDEFFANGGNVVWDIPLEVDASMSIAQIVGALTNDERLLETTNVIGDKLSDPWFIQDVRRLSAKAVGTPTLTRKA